MKAVSGLCQEFPSDRKRDRPAEQGTRWRQRWRVKVERASINRIVSKSPPPPFNFPSFAPLQGVFQDLQPADGDLSPPPWLAGPAAGDPPPPPPALPFVLVFGEEVGIVRATVYVCAQEDCCREGQAETSPASHADAAATRKRRGIGGAGYVRMGGGGGGGIF